MILRGRKASPTIIFSVWFCCWSFMVVLGLLWFLHLTERRCAPHLSYVSLSPAIGHVVPLDSLLMLWLTVMFPGILPASHTGTPYSFLVLSILTSIQQRTDPGVPSPPPPPFLEDLLLQEVTWLLRIPPLTGHFSNHLFKSAKLTCLKSISFRFLF